MASATSESHKYDQADGSSKVKVTVLASEWGSSKGGLSTINRELAIQLAKCPEVEITFFLPRCSQEDKLVACKHNIEIVEATERPGYKELEWLSFPPEHLQIDIIVGHGVKLGHQAQIIRDSKNCTWIQVVHTDPEELGMFKTYLNPISKGEEKHKTEVKLCEMADIVIGVGPKLSEAFRSYLRGHKKDQLILDFTPGVFEEFVSVKQVREERKQHSVLVFGRGDAEDFELKGFDIAGKAVAELPDTRLVFVGAPDEKREEIAERLTGCGVPANRLRVRGFVQCRESMKRLFQEVDLALMPSRTEGFGLTGLEALSAGLPVLVSQNSGFGEALSNVPFGSLFVIDSEDPSDWATAIKKIWNKDRTRRLEEAETLRGSYEKKYSWAEQRNDLLDKIINMVYDDSSDGRNSSQTKGEMFPPGGQVSKQNEDVTELHTAKNKFKDLQQMQCDVGEAVNKETKLSMDLRKIASEKGFIVSDNVASGNCMFYALSKQLQRVKGIQISHTELRRTLVHFLTENPYLNYGTHLFNFVSGYPSWSEYLKSMAKDGTWGGHLVLLAAANYFQTHIRIISSLRREIFIDPDHQGANMDPIVLGHVHNEHYVSLQPRQGTSKGPEQGGVSSACVTVASCDVGSSGASTQRHDDDQGAVSRLTSKEEETNFFHLCHLLIRVGSQVLRDTIDRIISPQDLQSILNCSPAYSKLKLLRKEEILNSMQWSKLYPAGRSWASSGSTTLDPALLIVLLRTICNLTPPPAGWDAPPHTKDTSLESDIARVKYFMNAVSSENGNVINAVFSNYWQQIRDTLVRLGGAGYKDVIEEIKNQEMDLLDKEHFKELLRQWKNVEDNTRDKLACVESAREEDLSHPTYFKARIRQLYKSREGRILPVPWCEDLSFHLNDIFTRPKILSKEKTRGTLTKEITEMTAIFKPRNDCPNPRIVLIEGEPGMGKTTYCQKLAYDWATMEGELDNSFPEIEVLLLLRCHDFKSNIWEAIDEQLLPAEYVDGEDKEIFFKFIRENQSKVLLVLDGLDETDPSKLSMYFNIIESKELSECYIVLTCRHEAGRKVRRHCDTLWEIVGFTQEDAKSFIRKYFAKMEHLGDKLIETIWSRRETSGLQELTKNPLNTSLLCILCEDFKGVFPTNRTQLYIELVLCVLRRYEKKNRLRSNSAEDLIAVYKDELLEVGQMALDSLHDGKSYLENHELNSSSIVFSKFGLLSVQDGGSRRDECLRYEFLHESFQDFFAGFYLAFQILSGNIDFDSIVTAQRYTNELKQVFLFMSGILASQSEKTAVSLVNSITLNINSLSRSSDGDVNEHLQFALDCISESTTKKGTLQSQLVRTFGEHLELKALAVTWKFRYIELLFKALTFNSSLTSLGLSDIGIGDSGASVLSEALGANSSLTNLDLSMNSIGDDGAASLSQALATNSSLTHLDLSWNRIGRSGAVSLSKAIRVNYSLTNLNLRFNMIDASGVASLSDAGKFNSTINVTYDDDYYSSLCDEELWV